MSTSTWSTQLGLLALKALSATSPETGKARPEETL
jgi:hypothetical protein